MEGVSLNGSSPLEGNYILNALNHINDLNDSLYREEVECLTSKHSETRRAYEDGCDVDWDSLLCWPNSPPGTLVKLPCFEQLHGIRYDNTQNASRWCWNNGTWDNYSNYTLCRDLKSPVVESGVEITTMLYFIGYSLSLSTLVVAVSIFLYFK